MFNWASVKPGFSALPLLPYLTLVMNLELPSLSKLWLNRIACGSEIERQGTPVSASYCKDV